MATSGWSLHCLETLLPRNTPVVGCRVHRRIRWLVDGLERGPTRADRGVGKTARGERPVAAVSVLVGRQPVEARPYAGTSRAEPWKPAAHFLCLRSTAHRDTADRRRQDGKGSLLRGVCAVGGRPLRYSSRRTSSGKVDMTGRHKFSGLVAKMPRQRQARVGRIATTLRQEMDLAQLREARALSQASLGKILHVEQPAVAQLEQRAGLDGSTLRRFIQAMDGEMQIRARLPD